jgi:hypothetical protein
MNLFKINTWIYAVFFTLPCLFFSEFPHIVSGLLFLFFIFLEIFLFKAKGFGLRHKLEVGYLIILASSTTFIDYQEAGTNNEYMAFVYGLIYILIPIDVSLAFRKYWSLPRPAQTFWVFISLLIPPLGIYYLKKMDANTL